MGRASDLTGRRVNAWHSSIQHSIRPSAKDSVREKAAAATPTPTDNICSYSYSSTYDESETYSDVETEDDEEDAQLKNRLDVLTAQVNELRTAQSMAAPAGRTAVKGRIQSKPQLRRRVLTQHSSPTLRRRVGLKSRKKQRVRRNASEQHRRRIRRGK